MHISIVLKFATFLFMFCSAENFEPFLSQVLKIRWEDELGKSNPLADAKYRYLFYFCSSSFINRTLYFRTFELRSYLWAKRLVFDQTCIILFLGNKHSLLSARQIAGSFKIGIGYSGNMSEFIDITCVIFKYITRKRYIYAKNNHKFTF